MIPVHNFPVPTCLPGELVTDAEEIHGLRQDLARLCNTTQLKSVEVQRTVTIATSMMTIKAFVCFGTSANSLALSLCRLACTLSNFSDRKRERR